MAIIIGVFAAVLLIAFLIFQVVGSINKNPGTESHTVPGVLGYTVEQAEQLDGVKDVFTIEVIGTRADSKYQPGQIVEQDPSAGRTRKGNLVIRVYVCAEEEKYMMPDVRNLTLQEAKLELNNMNLSLQIETVRGIQRYRGRGECHLYLARRRQRDQEGQHRDSHRQQGPGAEECDCPVLPHHDGGERRAAGE